MCTAGGVVLADAMRSRVDKAKTRLQQRSEILAAVHGPNVAHAGPKVGDPRPTEGHLDTRSKPTRQIENPATAKL